MNLCVTRRFDQKNRILIPKEFIEKAGGKLDGECYLSLDEDDNRIIIRMKSEKKDRKPFVRKYCVKTDSALFHGYIENESGEVAVFDSEKEAKEAIMAEIRENSCYIHGTVIGNVGFCFRCGSPLFPSDNDEYKTQCFTCNEDFYRFEQEEYIK